MKQTQSVGYTDMSSSLWVWLVMSVRGYDCSCLCSLYEFECLFHEVGLVPSLKSALHAIATASTPDRDPHPRQGGQVIVPVRPQQGSVIRREGVTWVCLRCRLDNHCYGEPKPWAGVGLEAGALAGGVVGAHYLGLGHHAVLLLREGIAVCRAR